MHPQSHPHKNGCCSKTQSLVETLRSLRSEGGYTRLDDLKRKSSKLFLVDI